MALDLQDLNPVFAQKLKAMLDAAKAQGVNPGTINSGFRSIEQQKELYQNHLAKAAGQPLPYPGVEAPSVVAPPGGSMHNFGLATDINSPDLQKLRSFVAAHPEFGIQTIGANDPGHFQLAGDQRALMAHPPALSTGTDFNPETALLAYTQPHSVLAANLPPPSPHGTSLTSVPPAAVAAVSHETPPAPAAPKLSPYQMLQKGDIQGALAAVTADKTDPKTGEKQPGTSTIGKLADAFQPQQQAQQQVQSQPMLQPQDSSAVMIGPSQQLLAQILASSAKPLTWSSRPYGSGLAGAQALGATLNTTGGLYNG